MGYKGKPQEKLDSCFWEEREMVAWDLIPAMQPRDLKKTKTKKKLLNKNQKKEERERETAIYCKGRGGKKKKKKRWPHRNKPASWLSRNKDRCLLFMNPLLSLR